MIKVKELPHLEGGYRCLETNLNLYIENVNLSFDKQRGDIFVSYTYWDNYNSETSSKNYRSLLEFIQYFKRIEIEELLNDELLKSLNCNNFFIKFIEE